METTDAEISGLRGILGCERGIVETKTGRDEDGKDTEGRERRQGSVES